MSTHMQRIRITIGAKSNDPADDLRYAVRVRQDLWAHSPVEIGLNNPAHGTHRDEQGNAYFEFVTDYLDEVRRVLNDYGHTARAFLSILEGRTGPECVNCGNISGPILPTVCPSCRFRDIEACPSCTTEVSRQSYVRIGGDLFRCPKCNRHVRLHFQMNMFDSRGRYTAPLIQVEIADG
jgi:hypothetical protein